MNTYIFFGWVFTIAHGPWSHEEDRQHFRIICYETKPVIIYQIIGLSFCSSAKLFLSSVLYVEQKFTHICRFSVRFFYGKNYLNTVQCWYRDAVLFFLDQGYWIRFILFLCFFNQSWVPLLLFFWMFMCVKYGFVRNLIGWQLEVHLYWHLSYKLQIKSR